MDIYAGLCMYLLYDKISIVLYRIKPYLRTDLSGITWSSSVVEGSKHEQSFICKITLNIQGSRGRGKLESREEHFHMSSLKGTFTDMWHAKRKCQKILTLSVQLVQIFKVGIATWTATAVEELTNSKLSTCKITYAYTKTLPVNHSSPLHSLLKHYEWPCKESPILLHVTLNHCVSWPCGKKRKELNIENMMLPSVTSTIVCFEIKLNASQQGQCRGGKMATIS